LHLDTDILVDLWRNHSSAIAWFAAAAQVPVVSGFAAMELLEGCPNKAARRTVLKMLRPLPIVSAAGADRALWDFTLYKLSHNLDMVDALIAATALEYGEPLATFNTRHYGAVPGLVTVRPYHR